MKMLKKNKSFFIAIILLLLIAIWHYTSFIHIIKDKIFIDKIYSLLIIFSLIYLMILYFLNKSKINPALLSFVSILLLGSLYLFIFVPMTAPDEMAHYISSYRLSNKILGQVVANEKGFTLIRAKDLFIEDIDNAFHSIEKKENKIAYIQKNDKFKNKSLPSDLSLATYEYIYKVNNNRYANKVGLARSSLIHVNTNILIYLPQAIGISVARILNIDTISLLFIGRFFNLLFFAILISISIYIVPYYKYLLSAIAILPMSLHIAASFSYDAGILAIITLFITYILKLVYSKKCINFKDIALLSICIAIFAPCKLVYSPFIFLIFLLPFKSFKNIGLYILSLIFIFIVFILSMYMVNYNIIHSYAVEASANLPYAAVEKYTLIYLLKRPREFISLYYMTILDKLEFYHMSMLGAYLGTTKFENNFGTPYIIIFILTNFLLILALDSKESEKFILAKKNLMLISSVIFMSIFLIFLSMLIAWTPMSSQVILGIQGRYFLPILFLALFSLKNIPIKINYAMKKEIFIYIYFFNIYILIYTFSLAMLRR